MLRNAGSSDRKDPTVLVVGDTHAVAAVACSLSETATVHVATDDPGVAAAVGGASVWLADSRGSDADPSGRATIVDAPSVADTATLRAAGAGSAAMAVVVTDTDRRALLAAQLIRTEFGLTEVVTLVNDPRREDALATVSTATVCGTSSVADRVVEAVEERVAVEERA